MGRVLLVRWNLEGVQGPQRFPSCRLKSTHFLTVCLILSPISGWNNDALSGGAENAMPTRLHRKSHCSSWLWPWRGDWSSFSDLNVKKLSPNQHQDRHQNTYSKSLQHDQTNLGQLRAGPCNWTFEVLTFFMEGKTGASFKSMSTLFPQVKMISPHFQYWLNQRRHLKNCKRCPLSPLIENATPKAITYQFGGNINVEYHVRLIS